LVSPQSVNSKLEQEINEKLVTIHQQLLQAGVDQKQSEREARLKDTLSNLQRIFPGVRGRVVDLCKPTQRKYEVAVSTVLGRNIDAVVVDEEKTAIECIEVRLPLRFFASLLNSWGRLVHA
jgi:structural maintenance of chromosome 1